jgi:hypothetical protein
MITPFSLPIHVDGECSYNHTCKQDADKPSPWRAAGLSASDNSWCGTANGSSSGVQAHAAGCDIAEKRAGGVSAAGSWRRTSTERSVSGL